MAVVLDVVVVAVFCAIGRGSHGEVIVGGLLRTAWPFEAGLLVGWVGVGVLRGRLLPIVVWPTGVVLWLATLVVGMALRVASGQGTAVSFIMVAAVFLALFLLGWRLLAQASRLITPLLRNRLRRRTRLCED